MKENYDLPKWLEDEMDSKELEKFQNEAEYGIYDKIKHYSSQLETPKFDEQKLYSTITKSLTKEKKVVTLYKNWIFRIAALFIISLGIYFSFSLFSTTTQYAKNGTKCIFNLPDNSEIVLNSGSKIEYTKWNWDSKRILQLDGEAFFKVAKGKKFQVKTSQGKVTVLGTQFNVKQRNNRFEISCYKGKVKVNCKNQEVIITKGMSVAFDNGKPITIPNKEIEKPEWLNNELVFYQEKLTTILSEYERHFNSKIKLESEVNQQLFSGTIPSDNIEIALKFITTTYHLKTVISNDGTYILKPINVEK